MKILQVNNHHRIIGGSDSVYFNTSELLRESGHEVVQFAAASEQDLLSPHTSYFPQGLDLQNARLRDLGRFLRNTEACVAIDSLIEDAGPFDIAHLHIYYGRLTASILPVLKQHGVPIVQTIHEYKLACPIYTMERDGDVCDKCVEGSTLNILRHRCKGGSLAKSIVVLAEFWASRLQGDVRLLDRIICVSDFQRNLMERAGIPSEKLTTLHNFVDPTEFTPLGPEEKEDYLLYFGRIETLKGVPTLIRAAQAAGASLKIVGTGAWSKDMAREIAGKHKIEALGFVSGQPLRDLIARARAVVVPSEWYENCPMTVLEAKAAGTPVIGARIGGIPELVRDGTDGLLFEAGNVDDLARAIWELDQIDISGFGGQARADILARFSPAQHRVRLLEILASVLKGK